MKLTLVLALAMLFSGAALAVSSVDAVNFVASSNYFLYDGETYTPPNVVVKYEDKGYWVVPVTSGQDVITYFPIAAESGLLSDSPGVNRGLFEVADNLRELQLLKASLSSGTGADWLFTSNNQRIFSEMALSLNDNLYQLSTLEATLSQSKISSNAPELRSSLASMSMMASDVSSQIGAAAAAENTFTTSPSPDALSQMKGSFSSAFAALSALNDASLSYQSGLTRLKNQIAVSGLDVQTKAQLEPLLRLPESIPTLRKQAGSSTQLRQALDARYSSSSLRIDSLLAQLEARIAKDRVHRLIYTDNDKLKDTGLGSLSKAQVAMLAAENRQVWVDQSRLRQLEDDYRKAVDYYNKRQFAEGEKSALAAIDDAFAVYRKGRKQGTPVPAGLSQDFLFKAAGAMIVLLVLLYVFNNRKKVGEAVSGKAEEFDPYK